MAAKKRKKRVSTKKPSQITGKDAFIVSFVARNGRPTAKQQREIERYLTPHVARAAFSDASKNKKGKKTLSQLKALAQSNTYALGANSISRKRVGLFRATADM